MRNVLSFHKYLTPISSIELDKSAIYFSQVGDTEQITATYLPANAFDSLTWSSSNTSVATVSQSGLVTCVSLGNCTITCSAQRGNVSATCDVVKVTEITMTNTGLSTGVNGGSCILFTTTQAGYYHVSGSLQSGGAQQWRVSGGTLISGNESGHTFYGDTSIDCIRYIPAGVDVTLTGGDVGNSYNLRSAYGFSAQYYGDYDPSGRQSYRYIRNSTNGNNKNDGNYWQEIQAMSNGTNVALNKTVTLIEGSWNGEGTLTLITDGNTGTPYYCANQGKGTIQVDLGDEYPLESISMRHYYNDSRTMYHNKLEVSKDGINWTTVFDSDTDGEYSETSDGKKINLI